MKSNTKPITKMERPNLSIRKTVKRNITMKRDSNGRMMKPDFPKE